MTLAVKYLNHACSDKAWREANKAILSLIKEAAFVDEKRAKEIYGKMPEAFMNQLVDDLHKLYVLAHDQ